MTPYALTLDDVKELLRVPPETENCPCDGCQKIVEQRGPVQCECGYVGTLVAVECACYDENALYCRPTSRGSGCFHGCLTCPWCDGGERDGFEVLEAIRDAVIGRPEREGLEHVSWGTRFSDDATEGDVQP